MSHVPPDQTWFLDTKLLGRQTYVFEEIDSTNRLGLDLADDLSKHGLIVIARHQNAGRGQQGRHWTAPVGTSILLSGLLFLPLHLRRPVILTAWATVAVCSWFHEVFGLAVRIKWPNDILLQERKVCGILIGQRRSGNSEVATVVGIGLNVNQTSDYFKEAGLLNATSLAVVTGQSWDIDELTRQFIHHLDGQYSRLLENDLQDLETRWRNYIGLIGQEVVAETTTGLVHGCLRRVSFASVEIEGKFLPENIRHLSKRMKDEG